jgi:hypothetical protein
MGGGDRIGSSNAMALTAQDASRDASNGRRLADHIWTMEEIIERWMLLHRSRGDRKNITRSEM